MNRFWWKFVWMLISWRHIFFYNIMYDLKCRFYVKENFLWFFYYKTLWPDTTLTYVLMYNFCPCFFKSLSKNWLIINKTLKIRNFALPVMDVGCLTYLNTLWPVAQLKLFTYIFILCTVPKHTYMLIILIFNQNIFRKSTNLPPYFICANSIQFSRNLGVRDHILLTSMDT